MVKIKDRVHPTFEMGKVGTVIDVRFVSLDVHLGGGPSQKKMLVTIRLDKDGTTFEWPADDVFRIE